MAVAMVVGLVIPAAVTVAAFQNLRTEAEVVLAATANHVSQLVGRYPNTWQYLEDRLRDRLLEHTYSPFFHPALLDLNDNLIVEAGTVQNWPSFDLQYPISDGWNVVGYLRLTVTYRKVIDHAGLALSGGVLVTAFLFAVFHFSVSRLIDRMVIHQTEAIANYSQWLEKALKERETATITRNELQSILSSMPDPVLVLSLDGLVNDANRAAGRFFGKSTAQALIGNPISSLMRNNFDRETLSNIARTMSLSEDSRFIYDFFLDEDDKTTRHTLMISLSRLYKQCTEGDAPNDPIGWVLCLRDISQLEEVRRKLEKSLAEKDVLLREVHHRVKNNLQVIVSLLEMQARMNTDPEVRKQLLAADMRVRSIAMVHDLLCSTSTFTRISMQIFIRKLLHECRIMYGDTPEISMEIELEDIELPLDVAVPLGQIISEIASNVFKHAFHPGILGNMCISLRRSQENTHNIVLEVSDNGIGLPAGIDWRTSRSLGIRLVRLLAENLEATIEYRRPHDGGTDFVLRFGGATDVHN